MLDKFFLEVFMLGNPWVYLPKNDGRVNWCRFMSSLSLFVNEGWASSNQVQRTEYE